MVTATDGTGFVGTPTTHTVTVDPSLPTAPTATIAAAINVGHLFTALAPVRVFDTRPDQPQGGVAITQHKYGGANILKVTIAGSSGVPTNGAGAVSLNVTAVDPDGPGYVTVFPCGTQPTAGAGSLRIQVAPIALMLRLLHARTVSGAQLRTALIGDQSIGNSDQTAFDALRSPV